MTKRYLVTRTPHYIGQRMVYPDQGDQSVVVLPAGVKPGRWLVLLDAEPAAASAHGALMQPEERFKVRHNGGGRWVVENAEDGSRASILFHKEMGDARAMAEAEAARLNAGGEVQLGVTDDDLSSAQEYSPAGAGGFEFPDA